MKFGRIPKGAYELLELVTPPGVDWQTVANLVRVADPKHREVRRHPRFTSAWAREQLDANAKGLLTGT